MECQPGTACLGQQEEGMREFLKESTCGIYQIRWWSWMWCHTYIVMYSNLLDHKEN